MISYMLNLGPPGTGPEGIVEENNHNKGGINKTAGNVNLLKINCLKRM